MTERCVDPACGLVKLEIPHNTDETHACVLATIKEMQSAVKPYRPAPGNIERAGVGLRMMEGA